MSCLMVSTSICAVWPFGVGDAPTSSSQSESVLPTTKLVSTVAMPLFAVEDVLPSQLATVLKGGFCHMKSYS